MEYVNIGNLKIEKTAVLAPLAGVSDRAYRLLCMEYGAAYGVSEMISAKGLCYNDRKTYELCYISDKERPCGLQIFGSEPEFIAKAVKICEQFNPDVIDINMGCPVPKVAGNGAGASLMKNISLAADIVRAAKSAADIPVTVKFRSGWDDENINAVSFAKAMEKAGADALAIHGRTKKQMYSGIADWDIIKKVKESVAVPVIGNGDVDTPEKCLEMYEKTGCDLVMIGRGSYGNPFIFKQIKELMETGRYTVPDIKERLDVMLYHIKLILQEKPENIAMREARKYSAWYITGIYGAAAYRKRCYSLQTYDDAAEIAADILKAYKVE